MHEVFVPGPRPTQNFGIASAGLLGSLGAVLGPADSFASGKSREAVRKAAKAASAQATAAQESAVAAKRAASAAEAEAMKVLASPPQMSPTGLSPPELAVPELAVPELPLPSLSNLIWLLVGMGISVVIMALGLSSFIP